MRREGREGDSRVRGVRVGVTAVVGEVGRVLGVRRMR
jgi:hypothetical protein